MNRRMPVWSIVMALIIVIFVWVERRVIFQEGNPIPVAIGMVRLSITDDDIVKVSTAPDKYLMKARNGNEAFRSYMESHGWTFVDQLGAGLIYEKEGHKQMFASRMMTRFYQVVRGPLG